VLFEDCSGKLVGIIIIIIIIITFSSQDKQANPLALFTELT